MPQRAALSRLNSTLEDDGEVSVDHLPIFKLTPPPGSPPATKSTVYYAGNAVEQTLAMVGRMVALLDNNDASGHTVTVVGKRATPTPGTVKLTIYPPLSDASVASLNTGAGYDINVAGHAFTVGSATRQDVTATSDSAAFIGDKANTSFATTHITFLTGDLKGATRFITEYDRDAVRFSVDEGWDKAPEPGDTFQVSGVRFSVASNVTEDTVIPISGGGPIFGNTFLAWLTQTVEFIVDDAPNFFRSVSFNTSDTFTLDEAVTVTAGTSIIVSPSWVGGYEDFLEYSSVTASIKQAAGFGLVERVTAPSIAANEVLTSREAVPWGGVMSYGSRTTEWDVVDRFTRFCVTALGPGFMLSFVARGSPDQRSSRAHRRPAAAAPKDPPPQGTIADRTRFSDKDAAGAVKQFSDNVSPAKNQISVKNGLAVLELGTHPVDPAIDATSHLAVASASEVQPRSGQKLEAEIAARFSSGSGLYPAVHQGVGFGDHTGAAEFMFRGGEFGVRILGGGGVAQFVYTFGVIDGAATTGPYTCDVTIPHLPNAESRTEGGVGRPTDDASTAFTLTGIALGDGTNAATTTANFVANVESVGAFQASGWQIHAVGESVFMYAPGPGATADGSQPTLAIKDSTPAAVTSKFKTFHRLHNAAGELTLAQLKSPSFERSIDETGGDYAVYLQLDLDAATNSADTVVQITLDGVLVDDGAAGGVPIAVGDTMAEIAWKIVNDGNFVLNGTQWEPEAVDGQRGLLKFSAPNGTYDGAFSFAKSAASNLTPREDTFLSLQAGADHAVTWVPSYEWNVDRLDGFGLSGKALDPYKFNRYYIETSEGGSGPFTFKVLPSGREYPIIVHQSQEADLAPPGGLRLRADASVVGRATTSPLGGASAAIEITRWAVVRRGGEEKTDDQLAAISERLSALETAVSDQWKLSPIYQRGKGNCYHVMLEWHEPTDISDKTLYIHNPAGSGKTLFVYNVQYSIGYKAADNHQGIVLYGTGGGTHTTGTALPQINLKTSAGISTSADEVGVKNAKQGEVYDTTTTMFKRFINVSNGTTATVDFQEEYGVQVGEGSGFWVRLRDRIGTDPYLMVAARFMKITTGDLPSWVAA